MNTADDLYEMGWNDALGGIRLRTGDAELTDEYVRRLLEPGLKGPTPQTRRSKHYLRGVRELAQIALDGKTALEFKGPPEVVEGIKAKIADRLTAAGF
jgi:hypothetical protein